MAGEWKRGEECEEDREEEKMDERGGKERGKMKMKKKKMMVIDGGWCYVMKEKM